jgi:hypothetical protein
MADDRRITEVAVHLDDPPEEQLPSNVANENDANGPFPHRGHLSATRDHALHSRWFKKNANVILFVLFCSI